jgi:hypothetical protein
MIVGRDDVAEFLLDHVPDHADGFGSEHVEREGVDGGVCCIHQREQTNLGAVAVRYHQLMVGVNGGQFDGRHANVAALVFGVELAAAGRCHQCDDRIA